MAHCPTNSTDCLLRVLVDQGSAYNWNPLNFAFTAILSVLALGLAVVSLIQGLLAAGPGRSKASRVAVGHFYGDTASTRFDRTELRFRTTVRVPVIELESITELEPLVSLQAKKTSWWSLPKIAGFSSPEFPASKNKTTINKRKSKGLSQFHLCGLRLCYGRRRKEDLEEGEKDDVALSYISVSQIDANSQDTHSTWSRLLSDTGLSNLPFETRVCRTDFLPSEVQAAPAYATLEALIITAILAGCVKYEIEGNFPSASGPSIQLEIREHPVQGAAAIYQQYRAVPQSRANFMRTRNATLQALGHIYYKEKQFLKFICRPGRRGRDSESYTANQLMSTELEKGIQENYLGCGHDACSRRNLLVPSWPEFFEQHSSYELTVVTALLFGDKPICVEMYPSGASQVRRMLRDYLTEKIQLWEEEAEVCGMLMDVVESPHQTIFFDVHPSQNQLVINDRYNLGLQAHHLVKDDASTHLQPLFPDDSLDQKTTSGTSWFEDPELPPQRPRHADFPLDPSKTLVNGRAPATRQKLVGALGDLLISMDALRTCLEYLHDNLDLGSSKVKETVDWLAWQLEEVDWYLGHFGGQDALCAALNLLGKVQNIERHALSYGEAGRSDKRTGTEDAAPQANDETQMQLVLYRDRRQTPVRPRRENKAPRDQRLRYMSSLGNFDRKSTSDQHHESVDHHRDEIVVPSTHQNLGEDTEVQLVANLSEDILRKDSVFENDRISLHNDLNDGEDSMIEQSDIPSVQKRQSKSGYLEDNNLDPTTHILNAPPSPAKAESVQITGSANLKQDDETGPGENLPKFARSSTAAEPGSGQATLGATAPSPGHQNRQRTPGPTLRRPLTPPEQEQQRGFVIKSARRLQAMETLLAYRAILYATLMELCCDTSSLLEYKNRKQIVQVL